MKKFFKKVVAGLAIAGLLVVSLPQEVQALAFFEADTVTDILVTTAAGGATGAFMGGLFGPVGAGIGGFIGVGVGMISLELPEDYIVE